MLYIEGVLIVNRQGFFPAFLFEVNNDGKQSKEQGDLYRERGCDKFCDPLPFFGTGAYQGQTKERQHTDGTDGLDDCGRKYDFCDGAGGRGANCDYARSAFNAGNGLSGKRTFSGRYTTTSAPFSSCPFQKGQMPV